MACSYYAIESYAKGSGGDQEQGRSIHLGLSLEE